VAFEAVPVAEGATAPESLRPMDRIARKALWKADELSRPTEGVSHVAARPLVKALRFP